MEIHRAKKIWNLVWNSSGVRFVTKEVVQIKTQNSHLPLGPEQQQHILYFVVFFKNIIYIQIEQNTHDVCLSLI